MGKIEVKSLTNPQALIVTVPVLEWADGVRALVTTAKKRGIILECISCEKIDESEDFLVTIVFWGNK